MPGPKPFPCGGTNQPPCDPQPATLTLSDGTVLHGTVHKEHGFHHFFEKVLDAISDAANEAGEAKWGGQ